MKLKGMLKIAGAIAGLIVILLVVMIGSMSFVVFDVLSYTATGFETLEPQGTPAGKALVAYDPAVLGSAKNAADKIAKDLQSRGYEVDFAGVRSSSISNVSGYDVIVVGGPVYIGNASNSVKAYLADMKPSADAKIGVFATGGTKIDEVDREKLMQDVVSLPAESDLTIHAVMKVTPEDNADTKCTAFVDTLLE